MLRPAGPVVDAVPCSGCGKDVDPLRTRHAAIFDQRLHYFCERACRPAFFGEGAARGERAPAPPTPEEVALRRAPFDQPIIDAFLPTVDGGELPPVTSSEDPRSLVEPLPRTILHEDPAPVEPMSERDIGGLLLVIAAVSGVLAVVLALADRTRVVLAARVVLAGVGAATLLGRSATVLRDPGDPHPALTLATLGVGVMAAAVALFGSDLALASEAAGLAGVVVAAAAAHAWLVEVARGPAVAERDALAADLEAPGWRSLEGGELEKTFDLKPGETIVIEPGELVPVDALVLSGESEVVPWRGATTPVPVKPGASLLAGARNVAGSVNSGTLTARCLFVGFDRAFGRIVLDPRRRADMLVPIVLSSRVVIERWAAVAAAGGAVLSWITRHPLLEVLLTAIAIHAAVATPLVALVAGVHVSRGVLLALRRGVVYRSADAWDRAASVQAGVFCARGTLLLGEPEVAEVEPSDSSGRGGRAPLEPAELLSLAAGALKGDPDPTSTAVVRACVSRGLRPEPSRNPARMPGVGVVAVTQAGEEVLVGSRALLLRSGVSMAAAEQRASELEALGRTVLLVAAGERLAGLIGLQDGIRPGARAAVQHLADVGIEPILLSGDSRDTCDAIARALDIEQVRAEILPAERAAEVKRIGEMGLRVAVLGRPGVDDEALGAAHVSVALGATGGEKGEFDVVLASADVRDAAASLALAARTRQEARTGLGLAVAPALVGALVTAIGVLPTMFPPLAGLIGGALAVGHVRSLERRTR